MINFTRVARQRIEEANRDQALNLSGKITCVLSLAAVIGTASAALAMVQYPAHRDVVSSGELPTAVTYAVDRAIAEPRPHPSKHRRQGDDQQRIDGLKET